MTFISAYYDKEQRQFAGFVAKRGTRYFIDRNVELYKRADIEEARKSIPNLHLVEATWRGRR